MDVGWDTGTGVADRLRECLLQWARGMRQGGVGVLYAIEQKR
jgi:hypothetical protein